ncbi:hypothetical protein K445DRAFT_12092 [Daldinia sp. EC12]|nr:hypothetical protein K445DRAFT_12092 [Daldinia sp. EC12]
MQDQDQLEAANWKQKVDRAKKRKSGKAKKRGRTHHLPTYICTSTYVLQPISHICAIWIVVTGFVYSFAAARASGEPTAKLTEPKFTAPSYDRHDRYEFSTPTHQRQQRGLHQQSPQQPTPDRRSTATPSSIHRLRRTPRFSASPVSQPDAQQARPPVNRVTVTLSPQGRYVLTSPEQQTRRERPKQPGRQLSQGNLSNDSEATSNSPPEQGFETSRSVPEPDRPEPHPAVRISKQTHSAILYALEQTLRGPKELSEDLVELYSPMADLMGGRGPATSNGNGASPARPTTARAAVGSPSGIRGPRIIMQERAAREAARERQREEQERERLEREHAENEARLLEEAKLREAERKDAERRAAAAAGAGTYGAGTVPAGTDPTTTRRPAQPAAPGRMTTDNSARHAGQPRVPTTTHAQPSQAARHGRTSSGTQGIPGTSSGPGEAGPSGTQPQQQQPPQLGETSTALGRGRNSFPHAFERWETLSAHWEGLTSFWIRRLEQNAQEISQDPISQQLSRQVTDLSSAGANLFHAVVELQRLRASSERKFQRWFFETRAEIERSQEVTGMLEAALEEERRSRADAIREAVEREQGTSKMQKQIAELRKELTISKEEARRAWEELGRREQEERDRTMSLQLGQPTIVGGVQVVPMTQGVGRGHSQRDPRSYSQPEPADYGQSHTSANTDRPQYSQAPPVKSTPASRDNNPAFQTPSSVQHEQSYGSEGTYSEGQYINGVTNGAARNPVRKNQDHNPSAHTNSARTHALQGSDIAAEEFETPATQPAVYQPTGSGSQQQQPQYSAAPDYSGAGYSGPWDDIGSAPRHHHPTRLSDVLEEEEERSRTSASQSQVSRP